MWKKAVLPIMVAAGAAAASPAWANVPTFAAKCPGDITVETDRAGRAYIDGKKATVRTRNANFSSISVPGMTVDVSRDAGSLIVTYTGRNRAHGVCEVVEQETVQGAATAPARSPAPAPAVDDVPLRDRNACVRAVQKTTSNRQTVVIRAISSEANNTVTIGVGPQRAPWRCLVKRGVVAGVMSLTDEGGL